MLYYSQTKLLLLLFGTALSHAEGCLGQLWVMSLSQLAHANLSTLDLFPLYNFPKIWQDFPDEQIKIIRQSSEFDAKLKNYFLSDLASNVIGCLRKEKKSLLLSFSSLRFFHPVRGRCPCMSCLVLPLFFNNLSERVLMELLCPSPLKFADPHGYHNL